MLYLDWLRVIGILGNFVFHVFNVFNEADFIVKYAECDMVISVFPGFVFSWGIPLLFLIAGAGSWFAPRNAFGMQAARRSIIRLTVADETV